MDFKAEKKCFMLDGKPYFLLGGEVQYFRIDQTLWKKHLSKLKEAGANTVSTYIPWSWHEIEEGKFDFSGETNPQRDILGFLDLVAELGLNISVKPGPYILAEFDDRGIPEWLTQAHPEIQAKNVDMITYMHPVFQTYIQKWYDAILPHLASRQCTRGGRIILLQVCNEVGLYNWLDGAGDGSEISLDYFRRYLKKEYKTIDKLNHLYGKKYKTFKSIPAPSKPANRPEEYIFWNDWHDFHRWYYAEYLSWLITEIRGRGIDIQLFHNIPGWVYGRGTEYPINITFYAEIVRRHPDMVFGVDHIPENPNYRNQHDDLVINEMVRALQGGEKPIWAAEQQAGTREHTVHTFPNEMELFYKACLARGMTGMNFYMFSQGLNPRRRGAFGPTFYWMTALGHDGQEKALFPVIKKICNLVKTFSDDLVLSEKQATTAVVFYRPYYHDEFYFPLFGGFPKLDAARVGLRYQPKTMRNTFYFEGMLRMLTLQNRDFTMIDIQTTLPDPHRIRQLWVMALDAMDRKSQNVLADYVEAGGNLVIGPGLPEKDLKMRPCAVLKQRLGIHEGRSEVIKGIPKIDLLGFEDINVLSPVRIFSAEGAKEIAHTRDGKCCGIRRRVGLGTVTLLGTLFSYNIKEHLMLFDQLYRMNPVSIPVAISNPAVQAHIRFNQDQAFLFLLNYTPLPQSLMAKIEETNQIPATVVPDSGMITLLPISGMVIPIHWKIGSHLRIIWSTAEITNAISNEFGAQLTITTRLAAPAWIKVAAQDPIHSVLYDGQPVSYEQTLEGVKISLPLGLQDSILEIKFK